MQEADINYSDDIDPVVDAAQKISVGRTLMSAPMRRLASTLSDDCSGMSIAAGLALAALETCIVPLGLVISCVGRAQLAAAKRAEAKLGGLAQGD